MKERDEGERKEREEMEKEMKGRDGERGGEGGKEKQGTEKGQREREKKNHPLSAASIIIYVRHHEFMEDKNST